MSCKIYESSNTMLKFLVYSWARIEVRSGKKKQKMKCSIVWATNTLFPFLIKNKGYISIVKTQNEKLHSFTPNPTATVKKTLENIFLKAPTKFSVSNTDACSFFHWLTIIHPCSWLIPKDSKPGDNLGSPLMLQVQQRPTAECWWNPLRNLLWRVAMQSGRSSCTLFYL